MSEVEEGATGRLPLPLVASESSAGDAAACLRGGGVGLLLGLPLHLGGEQFGLLGLELGLVHAVGEILAAQPRFDRSPLLGVACLPLLLAVGFALGDDAIRVRLVIFALA